MRKLTSATLNFLLLQNSMGWFTLPERKRFGTVLKEGKPVDAQGQGYGSWLLMVRKPYRERSWPASRIISCEMHGKGIELEGFYGSDHCPVSLELSRAGS
ncbi:hypothetical protein CRG98_025062 [Punica granatum]|uniref:Uncharacterized protein n=1 Tax=Punica granatum TaxID=22663 RepID=A0A2I0JE74_PUNGR|nr:hypothetical protein CRG98_025062 [Punica granatum]